LSLSKKKPSTHLIFTSEPMREERWEHIKHLCFTLPMSPRRCFFSPRRAYPPTCTLSRSSCAAAAALSCGSYSYAIGAGASAHGLRTPPALIPFATSEIFILVKKWSQDSFFIVTRYLSISSTSSENSKGHVFHLFKGYFFCAPK